MPVFQIVLPNCSPTISIWELLLLNILMSAWSCFLNFSYWMYKWCLMALICIFLIIKKLSTFSCGCWLFGYLILWNACSSLVPIFLLGYLFFLIYYLLIYKVFSKFYIGVIFLIVHVAEIFSQTRACLFTPWMIFPDGQRGLWVQWCILWSCAAPHPTVIWGRVLQLEIRCPSELLRIRKWSERDHLGKQNLSSNVNFQIITFHI